MLVLTVTTQTDQSRQGFTFVEDNEGNIVSIVSIKTDQSRLGSYPTRQAIVGIRFNRINPNRSIPTIHQMYMHVLEHGFQSYQSRQINPDIVNKFYPAHLRFAFQSYQSRQINPAAARLNWPCISINAFQSYQSKQINPDGTKMHIQIRRIGCFNRINPNRSIPT